MEIFWRESYYGPYAEEVFSNRSPWSEALEWSRLQSLAFFLNVACFSIFLKRIFFEKSSFAEALARFFFEEEDINCLG